MSMHYLLRGTIEQGGELYSPCKEAYYMLKAAVVAGQSLVFTRYHEAEIARITPHTVSNNQKSVSKSLDMTPTLSIHQP